MATPLSKALKKNPYPLNAVSLEADFHIPSTFGVGESYAIKSRESDSHICHGTWTKGGSKQLPVSFIGFKDYSKATEAMDRLDQLPHDNIPKTKQLLKMGTGHVVIIDRLPPKIDDWINLPHKSMWDFNSKGTAIRGLGNDFRSIFSDIFEVIRFIHSKESYHGNLRNGIRVTADHKVFLVNFARFETNDLEQGTRNDLSDLKLLVEHVDQIHDREKQGMATPACVYLFYELHDRIPPLPDMNGLRNRAKFVYHAPLVMDGQKRYRLIRKFAELRRIDATAFDNLFKDGTPRGLPKGILPQNSSKKSTTTVGKITVGKSSISSGTVYVPKKSLTGGASGSSKYMPKKTSASTSAPTSTSTCIAPQVVIPEFQYWQSLVPPNTPLYRVLTHKGRNTKTTSMYIHTMGVFNLHRNAHEHEGKMAIEIEKELYDVLPEAIPRLYNIYVSILDTPSQSYFMMTLAEFFELEPYSFP